MGLFNFIADSLFGNRDDEAALVADRAQFRPFNISSPLGQSSFNNGTLNLQGNQQLQGGFNNIFQGGTAGAFAGANDPFSAAGGGLLGEFGQANQSIGQLGIPEGFSPEQQQFFDQLFGGTAQATNQAGQDFFGGTGRRFSQAGAGFLDQLQQFDNVGFGNQQTALLRALARPQEQNAALNLGNSLFGSGRLGGGSGFTSGQGGGPSELGELAAKFGLADVGRQVAGQQLGFQARDQIGNFAQGFGSLGGALTDQSFQQFNQGVNSLQGQNAFQFNRDLGLNQLANQRAESRFARAGQVAGTGQGNAALFGQLGAQGQQGIFNFINSLLNQGQLRANIGAQQSGANLGAFMPQFNAANDDRDFFASLAGSAATAASGAG